MSKAILDPDEIFEHRRIDDGEGDRHTSPMSVRAE
jgi:hypothetical protein